MNTDRKRSSSVNAESASRGMVEARLGGISTSATGDNLKGSYTLTRSVRSPRVVRE